MVAGYGGGRPPWPGLAGDQVEVAHQLPDQLGADELALANELGVHATVPVGLIGMFENRVDEFPEVFAPNREGVVKVAVTSRKRAGSCW